MTTKNAKTELEVGSFRRTGTMLINGEYCPRQNEVWRTLEKIRCDEPLARMVDAALALAFKDGLAALPNHFSARHLLIASGGKTCLASPEPRFTDVDGAFVAGVYQKVATGSRPWLPKAIASNWTLAALAALLLEGNESNGVSFDPPPGPQLYGLSRIFGTPARHHYHGLDISADGETELEAEEFPDWLVADLTTLARRIVPESETIGRSEAVA